MRRITFLVLTAVATATAQEPAGTATAVGVVFDSVRGRPMAQARIRLDTTELVAVADADGRFRLEGIPPGMHFLRVEHPIIDSLGISLRSGDNMYAPDDNKVAELSTPSAEALVARFCAPAWRARGPAALFGKVREADTGVPATDAKVSLLWFDIGTDLRRTPRVREATVGPDGTYRICGLPAELDGKVQVIRGPLSSGDIPVAFGLDLLAVRSISIAAADAVVTTAAPTQSDSAGAPAPAATQVLGTARLSGRVLDRTNKPIVSARVQVDGTLRVAESNANGEFSLDSLPPGTQTVTVRKLGFAMTEEVVELSSVDPRTITLAMDDYVPVLETVRVSAQRERALDEVGFARRKRIGTGWHLDGPELTNRSSLYFSDILRSAPGINIQRYGNANVITNARDPEGCVTIWVDGTQWRSMTPGDIDEYVRPWEIGAVEVYSASSTPADFAGAQRGSCMTVAVWTQRRLDRRK